MIDHCNASRSAISNLGYDFLLCDWHAWRAIDAKINSIFKNEKMQKTIKKKILLAQHSATMPQLSSRLENLQELISVEKKENFWKYLTNYYLGEPWCNGFVDVYRQFNRNGIGNTNNASETFFKTLLRKFYFYLFNFNHLTSIYFCKFSEIFFFLFFVFLLLRSFYLIFHFT